MPKEEKLVDIDTSGEGAEINLEEQKPMKQVVDNSVRLKKKQKLLKKNLNKKQKKKKKK